MTIDDCKPFTATVTLHKELFKKEDDFNSLLEFLKLPNDTKSICIRMNTDVYAYDENGSIQYYIAPNYYGVDEDEVE